MNLRVGSWSLCLLPCAVVAACSSSSDGTVAHPDSGASPDAGALVESGSDQDAAPSPPPAAGGTGAFGIITVGGKQKMYLPQSDFTASGHAALAVVDVGVAGSGVLGAPAQLATVDLGGTDVATATGGDSTAVIAVSIDSPNIWFIDPLTDVVTKTLTLDATYGQSSFSGGGGFVTGVAVDSANHRAILSVWNGFAIVDLTTQSITSIIQAPPSENFGFDSVHQRIIAPFYDCTSSTSADAATPATCNGPKGPDGTTVMTDGLSVIDLTDGTVYTYEDPAIVEAGTGSGDPNEPVGREPDSAAIDPTTGIAIVPSEGGSFENVIDLSKASFDKTTRTVTAPHNIINGLGLTGVSVEPNSHLAFWEEEHSSDVAVANVVAANMGSQVWAHGNIPNLPSEAGGASFTNLGDPHGIAVTTGISSGGPVGFVVDSSLRWVARVDLARMAAAAAIDASGSELTDAQMASFVTFLDAQTKP